MQRYKKSVKSQTEQVKKSVHICEICGKKKSLRNLSKSEALIKEGGYLLSRIALQYHRRK